MPAKSNIPGGSGEQAIGQAKRQVKGDWKNVKTQAAFDALSAGQQRAVLRRFMAYVLQRDFGDTLPE